MWAFDSFQGLPGSTDPRDSQPNWKKGAMSTDVDAFHGICRAHGIPREAYTTLREFMTRDSSHRCQRTHLQQTLLSRISIVT